MVRVIKLSTPCIYVSVRLRKMSDISYHSREKGYYVYYYMQEPKKGGTKRIINQPDIAYMHTRNKRGLPHVT